MYSNSCCSCSFEPEIIKIGHIRSIAITFSNVYDNFKYSYEKSLDTYRMHLVLLFYFLTVFYTRSNWWFSLKSDRQRITSALQDYSQYSSTFRQRCGLNSLSSSTDFQFPQSLFQVFQDCFNGPRYDCCYFHLYVPQLFFSLARSKYSSWFSRSFTMD